MTRLDFWIFLDGMYYCTTSSEGGTRFFLCSHRNFYEFRPTHLGIIKTSSSVKSAMKTINFLQLGINKFDQKMFFYSRGNIELKRKVFDLVISSFLRHKIQKHFPKF